MVVLLDRLVAVADGTVSDGVDMVRVVKPVVAVVMADCRDAHGQDV